MSEFGPTSNTIERLLETLWVIFQKSIRSPKEFFQRADKTEGILRVSKIQLNLQILLKDLLEPKLKSIEFKW